ncbi:hypothetical protein M9H77_12050 [Catharanthus roseus]|uniref:Uncharacterized protein n=1 Tax=Catharanthus roseus TaxID=4058 RepID=A0ACC0BG95_CATRO|nr:hypothetical protein M9H77_12050 [Catharanthus roseus]
MLVLKSALDQFGDVLSVEFIPNYIYPQGLSKAALVDMTSAIRACRAEATIFANRITFLWLSPEDPDFVVANKIRQLTRKHAAEAECLLKHQLAEQEKLGNKQAETLQSNHKNLELIDALLGNATAHRLAERYHINLKDA